MNASPERRFLEAETGLGIDMTFHETDPGQADAFLEKMKENGVWDSLRPREPSTPAGHIATFVFAFALAGMLLADVAMIAVVMANEVEPRNASVSTPVAMILWSVSLLVLFPAICFADRRTPSTKPR